MPGSRASGREMRRSRSRMNLDSILKKKGNGKPTKEIRAIPQGQRPGKRWWWRGREGVVVLEIKYMPSSVFSEVSLDTYKREKKRN